MNKRVLSTIAVAVALVLLAGMVFACQETPVAPAAASPWSRFRYVRVLIDMIVDGDLTVGDDLTVTDDLAITGDLSVDGTTDLDDLDVDASIEINLDGALVDIGDDGTNAYSRADGDNDLGVAGDLEVRTGAYIVGATVITGAVTMDGDLVKVGGSTAFSRADGQNDLGVEGDLEVRTGAYIGGATVITGAVTMDGALVKVGGSTAFSVADGVNDLGVEADLEVRGTANIVGATTITGALSVDGLSDLDDLDVDASGEINLDGGLVDIGDDATNAYSRADGDNDLGVSGDLEVRTGAYILGPAVITGTVTMDGDLVKVGGSTAFSRADGQNDLGVEGDLEVRASAYIETNALITGTLGVDGATSLDDLDVDLSAELNIDGALTDFGDDGTQAYSRADGDNDVGIAGDLEVRTGAYVLGPLVVTGTVTLDGDLVKVGGSTAYSQVTGDGDLAVDDDIEVRGDIWVEANAAITGTLSVDGVSSLDDVDVDLSAELNIDGGLVDIGDDGTNAYTRADGDNDLGVAADLEVRGGAYIVGATVITGAVTMDGALVKVGGSTAYSRADGVNDLGVEGDLEARGSVYVVGSTVVTATVSAEQLTSSDDARIGDDMTVVGDFLANTATITTTVTLPAGGVAYAELAELARVSYLSVSVPYGAGAGGTSTLATIADGEIWVIHGVYVQTTTEWTVTAGDDETLIVGDGNDTDGFIAAAHTQLIDSFTEDTGFAAGWYGVEDGSDGAYTQNEGGFIYAPDGAPETIDIAWGATGDDLTAGVSVVWLVYTRIQ